MADAGIDFLTKLGPLLQAGRQSHLPLIIGEHWTHRDLVEFLAAGDRRIAELAAKCLSLVGGLDDCPAMVPLLNAADEWRRLLAEDALWQIWMRAGSAGAVQQLSLAVEQIQNGAFGEALERLGEIIVCEPEFAEPYHQAGIAAHSLDLGEDAERYYTAAVRRNPYHYAARTALGHLCVERDAYGEALRHYRAALDIHPNLTELRAILPDLHAAVARRIVA